MVILKVVLLPCRPFSTACSRLMSKKMTQKDFVQHTELKKVRDTEMVSKEIFSEAKRKNKETYMGALELFKNGDIRRRGSIEFITAALRHRGRSGRKFSVFGSGQEFLYSGRKVSSLVINLAEKFIFKV